MPYPDDLYSAPDLLARQRARFPLAEQRAKAKVQALRDSGATIHVGPLVRAARNAATVTQRVIWMQRAASAWAAVFAPVAPCRRGCAHCCRQAVVITRTEAELVARASGRKVSADANAMRPSRITDMAVMEAELHRLTGERHTRTPCPFLVDEACSVYDARPLACRALVNLDDDDLLCQHSVDGPAEIAYANAHGVTVPALKLQGDFEIADIRDWFPTP